MRENSNEKLMKKIENEKKIVKLMILKYCKAKKHLETPCNDCQDLIQYTEDRIENCPFMETKTYCTNCEVHCYSPEMRQRIKEVMRYSGPRMIFSHPMMTIDHLYQGVKYKLNKKKKE